LQRAQEEETEKGRELEALKEFSVDQKRVDWSDEVPCLLAEESGVSAGDAASGSEESIEGPYEDMEFEGLPSDRAMLRCRAERLRALIVEEPSDESYKAMLAFTEQQMREADSQWEEVRKRKKKV